MIPAFSACTESPEPGISTSRTVSATPITSTSLCPAPTVSRKITSFPAASSTSIACSVDSASPPRCPRVPIDRMKTPGSRKWSASRIRSPSSAPCVNGLDGSTEITPTESSCCADVADERADQRRLSDPGRPGHADRVRPPRLRVEVADDFVGERVGVLDEGDRARQRTRVAGADARGEGLARPLPPQRHGREGYSCSTPSSAGSGAAAETIGSGSASTAGRVAPGSPAQARTPQPRRHPRRSRRRPRPSARRTRRR